MFAHPIAVLLLRRHRRYCAMGSPAPVVSAACRLAGVGNAIRKGTNLVETMDMVRKLRPVGSAPRKVLIGVPVASPRTIIVFSPETKSSLIVQLRSGSVRSFRKRHSLQHESFTRFPCR